jgi:hypothetical protein
VATLLFFYPYLNTVLSPDMSRTNFSTVSDQVLLKIEPTRSSIVPYISGILFGLVMIVLTISFNIKFNTLYYYLILMFIIFYLIIDHGYRNRNNIRLIELQEKSLNIYKGKKMRKENIQLSNIIEIKSKKRLLSLLIIMKLKAPVRKKNISYIIASDNITNADILKLYTEISKLKGISQ